jgi:DHA1 family tetracycline resistance protein-like MFS transporter
MFLMALAHMVYPTTFVLYADYRFHWGPQMVGYTLALVGILAAIVQGGLIKKIVGWLGERGALLFGLACGTLGFMLYGFAPSGWWFWAAMPVAALWGVANPAAQAIMTHQVDPREQGRLQGAVASLSSVAGMIAPTLFTRVFAAVTQAQWHDVWVGATFFLAAAMVGAGGLLALRVTAGMPSSTTLPAAAVALAEIEEVASEVGLQTPVAELPRD